MSNNPNQNTAHYTGNVILIPANTPADNLNIVLKHDNQIVTASSTHEYGYSDASFSYYCRAHEENTLYIYDTQHIEFTGENYFPADTTIFLVPQIVFRGFLIHQAPITMPAVLTGNLENQLNQNLQGVTITVQKFANDSTLLPVLSKIFFELKINLQYNKIFNHSA